MIKKETINLNQKGKTLNEVFYSQFAGKVERMLLDLYAGGIRSEEHTSELQSRRNLVCRLLLEKKKKNTKICLFFKQSD